MQTSGATRREIANVCPSCGNAPKTDKAEKSSDMKTRSFPKSATKDAAFEVLVLRGPWYLLASGGRPPNKIAGASL